jgi:hypothetical protein
VAASFRSSFLALLIASSITFLSESVDSSVADCSVASSDAPGVARLVDSHVDPLPATNSHPGLVYGSCILPLNGRPLD